MKGLFVESKLEEYIDYFGLSRSKFFIQRMLIGILFAFLVFVAWLMIGKAFFLVLIPAGFILGYKIPFMRLKSDKKHDDMLKSFLFPQFLRYFISLISTQGNVYQTLLATSPYLKGQFKDKLDELIEKIEIENNFDYYTEFADYVGTNEAHMVMSMIYDFSEHGIIKEELEEMEKTIDKLNENKTNQMVVYKTDEQEKYMNMPIFASIFFTMSFAVILIVYNVTEIMKYTAF